MQIKNKLSDLMKLSHLETDQEGMLRGGFALLGDLNCGHSTINGNCNCNNNTSGCMGNGNCSCNTACSHNCDCNCNCVTTAPPKQPTEPTKGKGTNAMGMNLFMF